MSEEQINPQEKDDDDVEAHHWKAGPEKVSAHNEDDDDVEAHHWKAGPERVSEGPNKVVE